MASPSPSVDTAAAVAAWPCPAPSAAPLCPFPKSNATPLGEDEHSGGLAGRCGDGDASSWADLFRESSGADPVRTDGPFKSELCILLFILIVLTEVASSLRATAAAATAAGAGAAAEMAAAVGVVG